MHAVSCQEKLELKAKHYTFCRTTPFCHLFYIRHGVLRKARTAVIVDGTWIGVSHRILDTRYSKKSERKIVDFYPGPLKASKTSCITKPVLSVQV